MSEEGENDFSPVGAGGGYATEESLVMEDTEEVETMEEEIEGDEGFVDTQIEEDIEKVEDEQSANEHNIDEPANKKLRQVVKKPTSKWVLYLSEHRAECSKQHPELSFAEITKYLAEGYKTMSAEESERLENALKEQKEKYKAYIAETGGAAASSSASQTNESEAELIFPLARIKKLMKYDPDVKNVSKEATVAIAKCAEVFVARLALKAVAYTNMRSAKTLSIDDLVQTIHTIEAFDFLVDDFPKRSKTSGETAGTGAAARQNKTNYSSKELGGEEGKANVQGFFLPRETGRKHGRIEEEVQLEEVEEKGEEELTELAEEEAEGEERELEEISRQEIEESAIDT